VSLSNGSEPQAPILRTIQNHSSGDSENHRGVLQLLRPAPIRFCRVESVTAVRIFWLSRRGLGGHTAGVRRPEAAAGSLV
jgi:hypothetical protein